MQLADGRIKLLPFDKSDFELFLEISTCPNIMRHVSRPFTYEEAKSAFEVRSRPWSIESEEWLSLCITEIESGEKLGSIALKIVNHEAKIAEVGFIIRKSAQGRGIANSALKLLKEYSFSELTLNKLVAFCSVHNAGSYKLLEKQDFVREGCFKENTFMNNQYIDDYAYGLCKSAL
ncbi:GNAT family N-acetyltransferase [Colwellia psychrerythraea]|uniref:Acetyltransferase, GNAT family n=1 Tax=Colwellia psychrerythraea (strain 34H / ATCC BAA-681) TaxID=167879 RepID=Q480Q5_COLP3|nr:GNAT family protein [Colwellia psychrerythraea]AAZ26554.1 acetyltransferase, GNAT family [Colwellia psychrerythraea 34H]